jgi:ribosomal protein L6P/L9E
MADDKTVTDSRDRSRVAAEQDYEVRHLAQEAGISLDQARHLIAVHGNDRETLMQAAARLTEVRHA